MQYKNALHCGIFFETLAVMARPSRFVHPFAKVRQIMGLSQEKAAQALGISTSTLQQIERGILPVSLEIHLRMRALSGADIPEGVCAETIPPVEHGSGGPYDAGSLERWRKNPFHRERILRFIDVNLPLFAEIAEKRGYLQTFLWAVARAMLRLADDFGIREEAERLLDERRAKKKSSGSKKEGLVQDLQSELFGLSKPSSSRKTVEVLAQTFARYPETIEEVRRSIEAAKPETGKRGLAETQLKILRESLKKAAGSKKKQP